MILRNMARRLSERICERLRAWAALTGEERYEPAPLLARLAAEGRGFGSLASAGR